MFCGVDVAYSGDIAFAAAVVTNREGRLLESRHSKLPVRFPYVPGYFMLREAPAAKRILSLIKTEYDVLLVDGHGVLHPRHCGLASFLGVILDRPTIGVAKSLLCGAVRDDNFVELGGKVLGYALKDSHGRSTYVSVGHRISLESAVRFVRMLTPDCRKIPEPLRLADLISKEKRMGELRL